MAILNIIEETKKNITNLLCKNNELVIISALKEELLTNYDINNEKIKIIFITNFPFEIYKVITLDSECLYIVSGVGKANSASAIMYAHHLGAKKIIWFGSAGSAVPKFNINDIVVIKRSIYIDADYTPFGLPLGEMVGEDLFQYTTEDYSNLNYSLLKKNNKLNVFDGATTGTCDQFVIDFTLLDKFPKDYDIGLVDNENTSSLQISNSLNNKICIIRYVSDNLTDPTQGQVQTFEKTLILCSIFFRNYFNDNLNILKNY